MARFLLILAIVAVVALIVLRLKRGAARPHLGRREVESALLNVLTIDSATHDEWDYFLSRPLDDPHLESIRQRAIDICRRYPGGGERDMPEQAIAEVRALLEELRTHPPAGPAD